MNTLVHQHRPTHHEILAFCGEETYGWTGSFSHPSSPPLLHSVHYTEQDCVGVTYTSSLNNINYSFRPD